MTDTSTNSAGFYIARSDGALTATTRDGKVKLAFKRGEAVFVDPSSDFADAARDGVQIGTLSPTTVDAEFLASVERAKELGVGSSVIVRSWAAS